MHAALYMYNVDCKYYEIVFKDKNYNGVHPIDIK